MPKFKSKLNIPNKITAKDINLWKPFKKQPSVSIDSLPSELDMVVLRIGGYWYVNIIDNIIKTTITSNKDGVNTFTEAFQDAVDKIPKH